MGGSCGGGGSGGGDGPSPVGDWGEAGDVQDAGGRLGGGVSPCALSAGGYGSGEGGGGGCEDGVSPLFPGDSCDSGGVDDGSYGGCW